MIKIKPYTYSKDELFKVVNLDMVTYVEFSKDEFGYEITYYFPCDQVSESGLTEDEFVSRYAKIMGMSSGHAFIKSQVSKILTENNEEDK
jgi:hypothetical protein